MHVTWGFYTRRIGIRLQITKRIATHFNANSFPVRTSLHLFFWEREVNFFLFASIYVNQMTAAAAIETK